MIRPGDDRTTVQAIPVTPDATETAVRAAMRIALRNGCALSRDAAEQIAAAVLACADPPAPASNGVPANPVMRICHWCEDVHPQYLTAPWSPVPLYFCTDLCHREWMESSGWALNRASLNHAPASGQITTTPAAG